MNGKYSQPVTEAVDMIWTSYDREEMQRGYTMLFQAAQQGDADALAFVARCFMGEEFVWSGAGFATDIANASKLMQKSALMGSATGVLCAVRSNNLTPAVKKGMPFASFKEAFDEILGQAEAGNAFCCYMIGNVFYWGDYLLVEPSLAKQFQTENEYYAWAYPKAKEWYERSFDGRICAGWGNYCDIRDSGLSGITTDVYEAYFQALAEISPLICSNYGVYLERNKNNPQAALAYYSKAAYRGDPQGAYNAGHAYEGGEIVEENSEAAYRFFMMAANGGHPAGQFEAGYYHFEGCGGAPQDYAKAAQWFQKAYNNPKCKAVTKTQTAAYLGICFQDGLGVIQHYDLALDFLHEAEERIDDLWDSIKAKVLNALGVAYTFGRGTEIDIELGQRYLMEAANLDSEEAKNHLKYINSPKNESAPTTSAPRTTAPAPTATPTPPSKAIDPFYQSLTESVRAAVEKELHHIVERTDDEQIYALALVADSSCCSLFLAVNTIEYLDSEYDDEDEQCKWHPDEWGYSDGHNSELVELSRLLWENRSKLPDEAFFFAALIAALKQLKESDIFGDRTKDITFFVSISDDEKAEKIEDYSAKMLNSDELASTFLERER